MSEINAKKEKWLAAMAAHVVEHGLTTASLRPLAKAAGTSDRMLIYHFSDKDGVIGALLEYLAERFTQGLDAAIPEARFESPGAVLHAVVGVMRSPMASGYARVWLDIVAASARGELAYGQTGGAIITGFTAWVMKRLPEGEGEATARALLTVLEGTLVMDAVGHSEAADAAIAWFSGD
ncbi:TetR/AcrR family transcriptional regulator [Gymnodinialimonas hymeniacidonis]|uniref:TetR/AcrR family transcriptional regulator n=1 Tax=Gymnodinialimonas hymeniacidonis TaxID=3126508 RepID=UPI0034C68FB3